VTADHAPLAARRKQRLRFRTSGLRPNSPVRSRTGSYSRLLRLVDFANSCACASSSEAMRSRSAAMPGAHAERARNSTICFRREAIWSARRGASPAIQLSTMRYDACIDHMRSESPARQFMYGTRRLISWHSCLPPRLSYPNTAVELRPPIANFQTESRPSGSSCGGFADDGNETAQQN
jgi:hypothetical protein